MNVLALSETKKGSLLIPIYGDGLDLAQMARGQGARLIAGQDRAGDVRREKSEREHPADDAIGLAFGPGESVH